jgi:hypothetical protein
MIKEQLNKLKENWLIIVLILVLFVFMSGAGQIANTVSQVSRGYAPVMESLDYSVGMAKSSGYYNSNNDFAPEEDNRKITKTTSMTTEVERGTFNEAEEKLKSVLTSSDSFLLNENVNRYGVKRTAYYSGSYQIKVETKKYDSVVAQLKELGEVKSFNENARDITGSYTDTVTEIALEKERLIRYEQMYAEAKDINDKINLNDRIFNQERRVRYLEESLDNMNKKIDYSTIYLTITEQRSNYASVVLVKFSELVRSLVSSFNNLIKLVVVLIPWAIAALIIGWIVRIVKRRK